MKKIILSCLFILAATTIVSAQWKKRTPANSGFSISLPGDPKFTSTTSPSNNGNYTTNIYVVNDGNDIVLAGWVDYDKNFKFDNQAELEANRDNFVNGIKGTLLQSENITINGYPGILFSAKSETAYWTSKVVIVNRRPIQLLIGSKTGHPSVNEAKFFSSFEITK